MQYKRLFKYDPQCWMPSVEGHVICGHTDFVTSWPLYTSDAADDLLCVDLGGGRIIKKKNEKASTRQTKRKEYTAEET